MKDGAAPGSSDTRSRENNFDFLRLALATLVIIGHSTGLLSGDEIHDFLSRMTRGQIYSGRLAVFGFFTISGYLITQSWNNSKGVIDYLRKRVKRIVPGFAVASIASAAIFAPIGAEGLSTYWHTFDLKHYLISLFSLGMPVVPHVFVHSRFPDVVNGSMWTIAPEFFCYLLVVLCGLLTVLRYPKAMYFLAGATLLTYWASSLWRVAGFLDVNMGTVGSFRSVLPNMAYFGVGMACAVHKRKMPVTDKMAVVAALAFVAAGQVWHRAVMFVLPFALPVLIGWFAYTPRIRMQGWSKRFGDLSYGVYLYAFPVQQILIMRVPVLRHPVPLFVASVLVTFPLARASWRWVESPVLKRKKGTAVEKISVSAVLGEDLNTG